jgi:hypothetical protein
MTHPTVTRDSFCFSIVQLYGTAEGTLSHARRGETGTGGTRKDRCARHAKEVRPHTWDQRCAIRSSAIQRDPARSSAIHRFPARSRAVRSTKHSFASDQRSLPECQATVYRPTTDDGSTSRIIRIPTTRQNSASPAHDVRPVSRVAHPVRASLASEFLAASRTWTCTQAPGRLTDTELGSP